MASQEPVLTIYDTFAAEKRPLELLEPGKCKVYCCGPTVYDMSHIGHARAALLPDVLVRFLRNQGIEVKYARNITDIDDKIIKRANETGVDSKEVSEKYAAEYLVDLDAMGLLRPDVAPKVSDHIQEIIDLVTVLIEKGMAYEVQGDVYFSVENFKPYGGLSKRDLDNMRAGARVAVDDRKRAPADFALWKAAKPDEPKWESPWGPGRPGWHIECSAMSSTHLGETFDIHTGGMDLIFPHHENEIAQSQGACGEGTFARYWIHNGFVNFAGEKMAKSVGNFFTIREVTALYHPEVLRYFLLSAHYRRGVNFDVNVTCPACEAEMSEQAQQAGKCEGCGAEADRETLRSRVCFPGLEEADERVAYIYETLAAVNEFVARGAEDDGGEVDEAIGSMLGNFVEKMRDDLNTAGAYGELSEPLASVNRLLQSGKGINKALRKRSIARFGKDFRQVAEVLGCFEREPNAYLMERRDLKAARTGLDVAKVESLVADRRAARDAKDWGRADEIRDELDGLGVKIRDAGDETLWSL
jgi:cysteinyl-tRNA synthetase